MDAAGQVLLGLDLGTTGVKAGLVRPDGGVLASATVPYETVTPRPGWAEQHPEQWWSAAVSSIRELLADTGTPPESIAAVGVSGQMHGAVLLDGEGRPVRPCILWCDQRTESQCNAIEQAAGRHLAEWVANPALTGFTAPKLLWVREQEPEVYKRVATLLLPKDYLNMRLTGELCTEVSDASGTLLFDVARRRWSQPMLEALDIPSAWLPEVVESTHRVGAVSAAAAEQTGLAAGTPVAAGGADNACSAVGMGVVAPGALAVSIGSSGTVLAPLAAPVVDPAMRLHLFCHAVPDTWYLMGVMLSAGQSLRWFRDTLGEPEASLALQHGADAYSLLDETASEAPAGCEGLVFLPYLSGERTPHADPAARGVFFGLDLTKRRSHVVRSVMEGVVFALHDSLELMRELGVPADEVVSGGGGSRSFLWRQMQADVFNLPVTTAGVSDSAMLGAALLGGVACGMYGSIAEACEAAVSHGERLAPDPAAAQSYGRSHSAFKELYPALHPLFRRYFA